MAASEHRLLFAPTLDAVKVAESELHTLLEARRLQAPDRFNIELVFEELAVNIVRHGRAVKDVVVTIAFSEHETVLTFDDDGQPFDPREHPDPASPSSLDEAQVGGLGVMLVKKVATRLLYERTATQWNHVTAAIAHR